MHGNAFDSVPNKISNDRISIEARKNTSITKIYIRRRDDE